MFSDWLMFNYDAMYLSMVNDNGWMLVNTSLTIKN